MQRAAASWPDVEYIGPTTYQEMLNYATAETPIADALEAEMHEKSGFELYDEDFAYTPPFEELYAQQEVLDRQLVTSQITQDEYDAEMRKLYPCD